MTTRPALALLLLLATVAAALAADAALPLSADRINRLDRHGYLTPRCKLALVALVESQEALTKSKTEAAQLTAKLPALQTDAQQTAAQVDDLKKQLALYQHPEDSDYAALQSAAHDPNASLEKKLDLAQAFIWAYPTDPRQAEAVQDLQHWQNDLANRRQAEVVATANQQAAHEELLRRMRAHDLSLGEWQSFLSEMSQEELLANLGPPQKRGPDSWSYSGDWTWNPATKVRAGLLIDFNGARVSRVSALPP